jgi:hypothetical protein
MQRFTLLDVPWSYVVHLNSPGGVAKAMQTDMNNRRDYWYLSLIPILGFLAYYCAWRAGIAPAPSGWPDALPAAIPVSLSVDPSFLSTPSWAGNLPHAINVNAMALGVLAVAVAAGVVLFTWISILVIDAKRAAYRVAADYHEKRRGQVTGMLRPPEPTKWTSALVLDEEPKAYRSRLGSWIRHTYLNDRTSGALRHD